MADQLQLLTPEESRPTAKVLKGPLLGPIGEAEPFTLRAQGEPKQDSLPVEEAITPAGPYAGHQLRAVHAPDTTTELTLPATPAQRTRFAKTYSADLLAQDQDKPRLRGLFSFRGRLYVCTGQTGRGPRGTAPEEVNACEVVDAATYDGPAWEPTRYDMETGERTSGRPPGTYYQGRLASYKGNRYALTGPTVTFAGDEDQPDRAPTAPPPSCYVKGCRARSAERQTFTADSRGIEYGRGRWPSVELCRRHTDELTDDQKRELAK